MQIFHMIKPSIIVRFYKPNSVILHAYCVCYVVVSLKSHMSGLLKDMPASANRLAYTVEGGRQGEGGRPTQKMTPGVFIS